MEWILEVALPWCKQCPGCCYVIIVIINGNVDLCRDIYVAFILNICWVPIHEGINSDSWKHGKHSQSAYASIPTYITLALKSTWPAWSRAEFRPAWPTLVHQLHWQTEAGWTRRPSPHWPKVVTGHSCEKQSALAPLCMKMEKRLSTKPPDLPLCPSNPLASDPCYRLMLHTCHDLLLPLPSPSPSKSCMFHWSSAECHPWF